MDFNKVIKAYDVLKNSIPSKEDNFLHLASKAINAGIGLYNIHLLANGENYLDSFIEPDNSSSIFESCILDSKIKNLMKEVKHIKGSYNRDSNANDVVVFDLDSCGLIASKYFGGKKTINEDYLYIKKDFNYESLGNLIYETYGNKISFQLNESSNNKKWRIKKILFSPILQSDKIITNLSIQKANKIANIPGTYLFYGPPGTGKSTFIFSESLIRSKCIRIDSMDLFRFNNREIMDLKNIFNPDVLLIEELDKCSSFLSDILLKLESIRSTNLVTIITANDISKLDASVLRPQRVDQILHFDNPSKEEITSLVSLYSKSKDKDQVDKFIEILNDGFSHAYVVELSKKFNDNLEEISEYIKFLKTLREDKK